MYRAILELVVTIVVVIVARAILTSLFRSIANTPFTRFQARNAGAPDPQSPPPRGSELHKDPVCGTYVAESTPYQRRMAGQTFYYCSDGCREKHALVAH